VVAEGVLRIREEEGRQALVAWLGAAAEATPAQLEAIRDEWTRMDLLGRRDRLSHRFRLS
jgi:hypothetical protein